MNRQCSIKIGSCIKFLAAPLMIAGMFLNSACAVAEGPIPFNAMMQSTSAQAAVPPQPDAQGAPVQQVHKDHVTKLGKTEIGVGFFLLGSSVLIISFNAALSGSGFGRPSGAKAAALYGGCAGAAAAGVTLIAFGFHKRSAK